MYRKCVQVSSFDKIKNTSVKITAMTPQQKLYDYVVLTLSEDQEI